MEGLDRQHFIPISIIPERGPLEKELNKIGVSYFVADDREVHRDGWTFTADTLDGIPADESITLILGADAARGLPGWHRYRDIVDRADFAIMDRPGIDHREVEEAIGKPFTWLETPLLDVSGTMLRTWAEKGHSIRFFVRDAVWEYVVAKGLYGSK